MTTAQRIIGIGAILAAIGALVLPLGVAEQATLHSWDDWPVAGLLAATVLVLALFRLFPPAPILGVMAVAGGIIVIRALGLFTAAAAGYWFLLLAVWLVCWLFVEKMSSEQQRGGMRVLVDMLIPLMLGLAILVAWEAITRGGNVPRILLPSPSTIGAKIASSVPILVADFQHTVLKAVLIGYAMGCSLGFAIAIAIDRSPFLKRGLLPLGSFVSALPLVGIAPIMVMWFGFDWPSKAAVVVIMTFFPMLVNTIAGLNVAGAIERDMLRTYAAGYWQTLWHLRLPMAAPFIFNALKINSTLALIGAIVAEFFGTPIVGMGFRISTAAGRMDVDLVWAEIAVSALAGTVFYGIVALVERAVTFWHPSIRAGSV